MVTIPTLKTVVRSGASNYGNGEGSNIASVYGTGTSQVEYTPTVKTSGGRHMSHGLIPGVAFSIPVGHITLSF